MTGPDRSPDTRPSRLPGPEIIGSGLAVVVAAILVSAALAGGPGNPAASASPSPTFAVPPSPPEPKPPVNPLVVELLGVLNEQLAAYGEGLSSELDRTTLRTGDVAQLIRQINSSVRVGGDAVKALDGALGPDEAGGRMGALYAAMGESAAQTLGASLTNDAAYRIGAAVLVDFIGQLPALQEALVVLAAGPPPTPSPSASPPPSPSPSPTPAPPSPSPSPTPSAASPSASVGPSGPPSPILNEQIENGGFEAGVDLPWALYVVPGASASLTADTVGPAAGKVAARVDISVGSAAYSGISLRQAGLQLEAGGRYTLTLAVRGAGARDIRIHVTSTAGATYLTQAAPVGLAWAPATFNFTAPVNDSSAVLEIELGRYDSTTWIDMVSFYANTAPQ